VLRRHLALAFIAAPLFAACASAEPPVDVSACQVEFIILGVGQDAGIPQIGHSDDPAWADPSAQRLATSAALVDHRTGQRFLFEATPDMRRQMKHLDDLATPSSGPLGLAGIFLTHAHIGHYAGLMFAGRESASTSGLPVHVMPRLMDFLSTNGPWDQLVTLGNITLQPLQHREPQVLAADIRVTPYLVPHRDEYSETVGYVVEGPSASALFLPDIDDWDQWQARFDIRIEDMVAAVDYAFLDATFFDDNELPGRDMTLIPHPRVADTMARFADAPADIRARIHFIHFNHTNGLRDPGSVQSRTVRDAGFAIAQEGQRACLGD
jgi:pyrroloquinoline quinone biosynthesis protein B